MNAVEEIEAAIAKLSGLKEAVTPKYFETMSYYLMGKRHPYSDLALTLHRTIDAQLAILRGAVRDEAWNPAHEWSSFMYEILALARAINGTHS